MKAEELFGLLIPITYIFFFVTERLFPRRQYPPIRFWTLIGFAGLIVTAVISTLVPLLLPEALTRNHLFDASGLGLAGGILVGYLLSTLATALMHRAVHKYRILWVGVGHQLHHSPPRMDIPGSGYIHPIDIAQQTVPFVVIPLFVLGLDPVAAAAISYIGAFFAMFQHWNVKTPRWLGYIIQRPESHGLHHELGIHARNYSDLPLWDILMGTFANPERFDGDVGFAGDAPNRRAAMLLFRDVNAS